MRLFPRLLLPAALLLALGACSDDEPEAPAQAEAVQPAPVEEKPRVVSADTQVRPKLAEKGVQAATGPVMDPNVRRTLQTNIPRGHRVFGSTQSSKHSAAKKMPT